MCWLYILQSEQSGAYYVGVTNKLDDRIPRHNGGRSKSTKSGRPWKVVYSEQFHSKSQACIREHEIKSWKSRALIEALIKGEHSD